MDEFQCNLLRNQTLDVIKNIQQELVNVSVEISKSYLSRRFFQNEVFDWSESECPLELRNLKKYDKKRKHVYPLDIAIAYKNAELMRIIYLAGGPFHYKAIDLETSMRSGAYCLVRKALKTVVITSCLLHKIVELPRDADSILLLAYNKINGETNTEFNGKCILQRAFELGKNKLADFILSSMSDFEIVPDRALTCVIERNNFKGFEILTRHCSLNICKALRDPIENKTVTLDMLRCCLEKVSAVDQSLLSIATKNGSLGYCEMLVHFGWSPLHVEKSFDDLCPLLLSVNHPDILDLFLSKNIYVDKKTDCGWSPITQAAFSNNLSAVRKLVDAGSKDLDAAISRTRSPKVFSFLLTRGAKIPPFFNDDMQTRRFRYRKLFKAAILHGHYPPNFQELKTDFEYEIQPVFSLRTLCIQVVAKHKIKAPESLCLFSSKDVRTIRKRKRD